MATTAVAACAGHAHAAPASISFDELYGKISVLGLTFSDKIVALKNEQVRMRGFMAPPLKAEANFFVLRSEEHTSELQSLMRISYAVFCLKKKKQTNTHP